MANEFKKVTAHYGYQYCFVESIGKEIFAVYNISNKRKRLVSGFDKEKDAKNECQYLEKLKYGEQERWKTRNG